MPCSQLASTIYSLAETIFERCQQLSEISESSEGIARFYLTPEHKAANALVSDWLKMAGMEVWQDEAANICGRYSSNKKNAPTVILGSHLDTVNNAGKYDGILGVLTSIAIIELVKNQAIELPFHLDVIGFGDEEGARFGTTLLGSCAVAGKWKNEWQNLTDANNVSLQSAMKEFGLEANKAFQASRANDDILAYLELHIEQGPVLEKENLPVGIVTSIAGAKRYKFKMQGMAGHAGTVPMELRQDPLVAASLAIIEIEKIAKEHNIVATVGEIQAFPGAVNVIPGECSFTLDIRSGENEVLELAIKKVLQRVECICNERRIEFTYELIHSANAVPCAEWIQKEMAAAISEMGLAPLSLMSGAGHDAMVFGDVTDVGMLFVRCHGGISHNPLEAVSIQDIAAGLDAFYNSVLSLSRSATAKAK